MAPGPGILRSRFPVGPSGSAPRLPRLKSKRSTCLSRFRSTATITQRSTPLAAKSLESGLQAVRKTIEISPDGLKSGLQTLPFDLPPGYETVSEAWPGLRVRALQIIRLGSAPSALSSNSENRGLDGARPSTGSQLHRAQSLSRSGIATVIARQGPDFGSKSAAQYHADTSVQLRDGSTSLTRRSRTRQRSFPRRAENSVQRKPPSSRTRPGASTR